ncbi:set10, partial [Symbiodinium pilosum]
VYNSIFPALSLKLPSAFPAERYTFRAFLWARSSLSSRCFSMQQLRAWLDASSGGGESLPNVDPAPGDAERLADDCPAVLCPLLDMTNHDPETRVHVGLVHRGDAIHLGISCATPVAAGAEFFNNYGSSRTNLQLLLAHGFCVPNNKADTLPIKILSDDSKRPALQRQALELCGLQPGEVHELTASDLLPARMLALLRILCMSERGLQSYVPHGSSLFEKLKLPVPPDDEKETRDLEMQVLCTVEGQLLSKQSRIRPMNMSAASGGERHAAVYRAGQLAIISEALAELEKRKQAFCKAHGLELEEEDEEEEQEEADEAEEEEEEFLERLFQHTKRRRL